MFRVFIIAEETEPIKNLGSELSARGLNCSIASAGELVNGKLPERAPDLVLVAIDGLPADSGVWSLPLKIKEERHLPVIALLSRGALGNLDSAAGIDDFVTEPWDVTEVAARMKRTLQRAHNVGNEELIKCDDLVIDLAKCEVSINSRTVMLTFKEYELLRFLASNKGRVFTRQALLDKVWGYDYYGGDRTVDVHVRRLRSKLEDANHTFIETVRNIGYRFKR